MNTNLTQEERKEISDKIDKQIMENICKPVNPKEVFNAYREYYKHVGIASKEANNEPIEFPEREIFCSGMEELNRILKEEFNTSFSALIPLELMYRKVEYALYLKSKALGEDLSNYNQEQLDLLQYFNGTEAYILNHDAFFLLEAPEVFKDVVTDTIVMSHCEDGPYLKLPGDKKGLYALNDIIVPSWIVEKKVGEVSAKEILSLQDTDQRKIAIKKFGALALIDEATVLEDDGEYRLIDLASQLEVEEAKFLRMVNPSTNEVLVLGVHNDCKTIKEALTWRASNILQYLTIENFEWNPCKIDNVSRPSHEVRNPPQIQQGDVCILEIDVATWVRLYQRLPNLQRNFVLSPENQRNHSLTGKQALIYGTDEFQAIAHGESLKHHEHNEVPLPAYCVVWSLLERDHIENATRIEID